MRTGMTNYYQDDVGFTLRAISFSKEVITYEFDILFGYSNHILVITKPGLLISYSLQHSLSLSM